MDEVVGDVGELLRVEAKLRGFDILALGGLHGGIDVGGKAVGGVVATELNAADLAEAIVERCQNDRGAELAFIDEVLRGSPKTVDP